MPSEPVRPSPPGLRRVAPLAAPVPRPPERAQLVWRRALDLAGPPSQHDRFGLALDLLRAAGHGPATMAHALTLGRSRVHAHPEDALARGGVAILEEAIAFLGIRPQAHDVAGGRR